MGRQLLKEKRMNKTDEIEEMKLINTAATNRIKYDKVENQLTQLDAAIDAAMEQLTTRQQRFAMLVAAGKPADPAIVRGFMCVF